MSKLKELFLRHWALGLGAVFAVGVFCVWYFGYPQKMMTWEQSALFIWDREYYEELTTQPGGWWIYLRSFIAQFFIHPMAGAAVLALISGLLLLLTYWLFRNLTPRRLRQKGICTAATFAIALLPPLWLSGQFWHPKGCTDEEMHYDYLLRYARWQDIAEEGLRQEPRSVACKNLVQLARYQTGQTREEELFMTLAVSNHALSDRTSAFIMSDVYFHTGLVNMSQRAAFEAMESIEDFNKSGRSLMRLTETNIVTGNYKVALKYIALMDKTLFYRGWVRRIRPLAEDPERIASNPAFSKLRQLYDNSKDHMFY